VTVPAFEAEVYQSYDSGTVALIGPEGIIGTLYADKVGMVKAPPPRRNLKPGDAVKSKYTGHMYLLGERGYTVLRNGRHWPYDDDAGIDLFDHDDYELVELTEVPF
jgi:hypothetical protein